MQTRLIAGIVLCLALGMADIVYLNLQVMPSIWATRLPQGSAPSDTISGGASSAMSQSFESRKVDPVEVDVSLQPQSSGNPEQSADSTTQRSSREHANTSDVQGHVSEVVLNFPPLGFRLEPEQVAKLSRVLDQLPSRGQIRVHISGHSDRTGYNSVDNTKLSRQRAESIAVFLQGRGFPAEQITLEAHGASQPVDRNNTPAAWAKNRRAEVRFFEDRS
ncbi:MAG: OmpA family protein [bacterium]